MRTKKKSYAVYAAWDYEKEIEKLNRESQAGWQLEKGGCFHSVFYRDEEIRYVYQLDYTPQLEDKERYIELFEEMGWEYVNSTFNGWNYFRKPYREGMAQEETQIYTDRQSLYEMQSRYIRMMNIFTAVYGFLSCIMLYNAITDVSVGIVMELLALLIMTFMFGMARFNISRKRKGLGAICDIPFVILYSLGALLLIAAMCLL